MNVHKFSISKVLVRSLTKEELKTREREREEGGKEKIKKREDRARELERNRETLRKSRRTKSLVRRQ